jgi:hypothetical protein
LINTPNTTEGNDNVYPDDWHVIDHLAGISCRQTSNDTYQLTNGLTMYTVNKEGFDVFRENHPTVFYAWLKEHKIQGVSYHD